MIIQCFENIFERLERTARTDECHSNIAVLHLDLGNDRGPSNYLPSGLYLHLSKRCLRVGEILEGEI